MTRDLIIEGQHVDLAPDTDITLEYTSNILGDIGKISLSHSYTIKLPKTIRNARILDDPDNVSRQSSATRRYLSARFYRNDIDLIGPAQAYILKSTPESYEIALVWNTLDALQALSQSEKTLNDLPDLPVLAWISQDGKPDYTGGNDKDGAIFAYYNSGLGGVMYPTIDTATHPAFAARSLIERILTNAEVPYIVSNDALARLESLMVLAAPNHKPNRQMELESGSVAAYAALMGLTVNNRPTTDLYLSDWQIGWDAPSDVSAGANNTFTPGGTDSHRVLLNLQYLGNQDLSGLYLVVRGWSSEGGVIQAQEELLRAYFKKIKNASGWYLFMDEEINISGWQYYSLALGNQLDTKLNIPFTAYDTNLPLAAAYRVHTSILPAKDNRFPIQGNLPDLKQWDFIKACMAMLGWVAVIQNGRLILSTYDEVLNDSHAYDWTSKVDMSDGGTLDLGFTLNNWAQANTLMFQEDTPLGFEPNANLMIQDTTLPEQRNFYELPFAASMQSDAHHYKVDGTEVEDIDIAPRVFKVVDKEGVRTLEFTEDLYGEKLKAAHYAQVQEVIRKPIVISVNVRLHELDLAQLDLTRTVYLGQFGHFYKILKVQTSATDLCKVELIQIA